MSDDSVLITPVSCPVRARVQPPGSKSITNRALPIAAAAVGQSTLHNMLDSQDTQVMTDSLRQLGIRIDRPADSLACQVTGCAGRIESTSADLWLENSGTSIRFLTALCATGHGRFRLDGNPRMRERPIGDLGTALSQLGIAVDYEAQPGFPPLTVNTHGMPGGEIEVPGNISSQFLSGLLMAAPLATGPVTLSVTGQLVSVPYIEMTLGVMRSFGVEVERPAPDTFVVAPQRYQGIEYLIEPDASAASYFFAAAAITGGEVTVPGLSRQALQGDVGFVQVLEQMGCEVEWQSDAITVRGGALHGVDVDMNAISDTAQTLAAVAVFAAGPTNIRNVEHMRHKETDRVAAVATELRKLGIRVEERQDGLLIEPGPTQPATIDTYDDHRMAMSFSLIGLKREGVRIADPGCTSKTFPNYFEVLAAACGASE